MEVVNLNPFQSDENPDDFALWVGLNNGNGRGSMDALWIESLEIFVDQDQT